MSINQRKGIILAGGSGTRLYPLTAIQSKQLLPIYDKPMIYYPLSTLMLAGIREIALISTPEDIPRFSKLLGDGSQWNIEITYIIQENPNGIAEAFILCEDFIQDKPSALILGDNIFYGDNFRNRLIKACSAYKQNTIFSYKVSDPERYGVVTFDKDGFAINIEEKPHKPASSYAVTGLYFYDNNVVSYAKKLNLSERGELEITDLNKIYLNEKLLYVEMLGRGFTWLDTGTYNSLLEAGNFISTIENRHGQKIACPEEIAYRSNWISKSQLVNLAEKFNSEYGIYLKNIVNT